MRQGGRLCAAAIFCTNRKKVLAKDVEWAKIEEDF
jgi:hypothetical protein